MNARDNLINYLNSQTDEQKDLFWFNNKREMKPSNKDGMLEYNWYYFPKKYIWMCKVYDYDQMKEGNGLVRQIVFFKERQNLTKNKQWSVL